MNFFSPMQLGPLGVLLFFTMIYVVAFGICTFIVRIFVRLIGKPKMQGRDYVFAAILALGPLMLLMVQSFGSLSPWTIGLVGFFEILGCFMVGKVTKV